MLWGETSLKAWSVALTLAASAGLALAQTPAAATAAGAAKSVGKGDRELGEYLSNQCTTCHQLSGKSAGAIPPIVGWPENQFVAVIQSYKEGVRDNETMRTISHRFTNEEIDALASYFGSITPAK